jgi:hypothetical protein
MRDGFWKLVVPGDVSANRFEGLREDLQATVNSRRNAEQYSKPPDAVGCPVYLDEPAGTPMLFNLSSDPLETIDYARAQPERVSRMMRELENWFEDVERDRSTIPDRQHRTAAAMRAERARLMT